MNRLATETASGRPGSWQSVVENALDSCVSAVALADLRGGLTYVNNAFLDLWGLDDSRGLSGKPLHEVWESREKCLEALEAVADGHGWVGELEGVRSDGTPFSATASLSMVTGADGTPLCVMGSFADITDRKKAETSLRESEHRYRELFDNMSNAVAVYEEVDGGADFIIRDFNRAGERIEKVRREDIIGRRLTEVFPGAGAFGFLDVLRRVRATGRPERMSSSLYVDARSKGWRENYVYRLPSGELVAVYDDVTRSKETVDALLSSEKQYRGLVEQSLDGIFVAAEDGRLILANAEACRMLGCSEAELLRLNVLDTYLPGTADEGRRRLAQLKSGEAIRFQRPMRRVDGGVIFVEGSAVRLDDGRLQATLHDVTERRKAEEERKANERFLQSVLDGLQDGLTVLDSSLTILRTNVWLERMFASRGKLAGRKCYEVFHGRGAPCPGCPSLRTLRSGNKETQVRQTVLSPDEKRWVSVSSYPWRDEAGEIIGVIEHVKDVTEAKEAEDRLMELAQRWQTTFDAITDAVALLDADGRVLQCNAAMADMAGMPASEVQGRICWEIWFGDPAPAPGGSFERMRASRTRETEVFTVNGRWFELAVDPVFDGGGSLLGAVHIASDITGKMKAEAALVQAQKLASVGQLAAGVAHEINNPLSALSGEIQLLSRKTRDKAVSSSLRFMDKVSRRIALIVSQLLMFSRETRSDARETMAVNSLVESSLRLMEPRLRQGGVKVSKKLGKGLPDLFLSRGQMEQVLLNLISNSFDAMPGGGRISLTTGLRQGGGPPAVEIVVEDTGEGIPKEDLARVFDPFFTKKPPGKGVGLGLSVSHGIVLNHGGRIGISSEEGKGTRVVVTLPIPGQGGDGGSRGGERA